MTYETQALLMDVGICYWLAGFRTVGEAIDIARVNLHRNETKNYNSVLAEQYGVDGKQISDMIRRAIAVAWRGHCGDMYRILGIDVAQPPSPRNFVYAAAEYLNKQEGR